MSDVRRWVWVGLFLAALLTAWLASPDLPSPARPLAVFLVTFLPALMLLQGRMLRDVDFGEFPRSGIYLSSSLALWVLSGLTLAAALASGFSLGALGLVALPPLALLGWSAALIVTGVTMMVVGRMLHLRETPLLEHMLPRTPGEKLAFFGVAVTAGVCEEFVFRGFLIPALTAILGSVWAAALVSSLVFGFLHGYQGVVGVVRTTLLGLLLAVPFLLTGSILPSMIAHFALDVIAGIWLSDWLLRRS